MPFLPPCRFYGRMSSPREEYGSTSGGGYITAIWCGCTPPRRYNPLPPEIHSHGTSVRRGVQDDTSSTYNRKAIAMKAFAVRILSVLVTAGLVWLPAVAQAGISFNGID